MLGRIRKPLSEARVAVLGLTFKEDLSDLRNSKVPDIIHELRSFGLSPLLHDPLVTASDVREEYGLDLTSAEDLHDLDAIILAVAHRPWLSAGARTLLPMLSAEGGIILDVKAALDPGNLPDSIQYWSL